jgi:hypothetical protein
MLDPNAINCNQINRQNRQKHSGSYLTFLLILLGTAATNLQRKETHLVRNFMVVLPQFLINTRSGRHLSGTEGDNSQVADLD